METLISQKTEKYLSDVNHHLENLKLGIDTLQLDYNKEKSIFLFCEKSISKLNIIEKLINSSNLSLPLNIVAETNNLFLKDQNLSSVHIQLINSKRAFNANGIAYLKFTV